MIETRIESRIGLVATRLTGDVTYDDLIRWYEEIERDERFSKDFKGVSDMRRVNMKLTRSDMTRLIDYVTERRLILGRWAILVEDAKVTALSMIYGRESDLHEMEVFSSEEAASDYLGLDVQPVLKEFPPPPPR